MTREAFERLVAEAVDEIPERFRKALENVVVVVEDQASTELLEETGLEPPDTLLGLYQGIPLTEREWGHGNVLPDQITLFQRAIEAECRTCDEIRICIAETVIHEVGHYFGLSEDEIEAIEQRYWRDEPDGDGV